MSFLIERSNEWGMIDFGAFYQIVPDNQKNLTKFSLIFGQVLMGM
jgi:hypothetical protein